MRVYIEKVLIIKRIYQNFDLDIGIVRRTYWCGVGIEEVSVRKGSTVP